VPIHHLQLWVPDLPRAERSWGWLLGELGFEPARRWEHGQVWRHGALAIVIEASPDMVPGMLHSRLRPGLNHVAFHVASRTAIDELLADAPEHGWTRLGEDPRHPLAPNQSVALRADADGVEVELVAPSPDEPT
jgi:catechol 2,3-dioxygenase-like lactoylglutathione lyase family enzyme